MPRFVFASNNAGKCREAASVLAPAGITLQPQSEWQVPEVEETGLSFVENALIKARHAARFTGLPAIADDSGLEVDALNKAPGIYSARFAGPQAKDNDNIEKLLAALEGVPSEQRTARFQCVMVLLQHPNDPTPLIAQGTWHGSVLTQPQGSQGFGYDPIFWVAEKNCSAAELSLQQKNQLSHRGQALKKLLSQIQN